MVLVGGRVAVGGTEVFVGETTVLVGGSGVTDSDVAMARTNEDAAKPSPDVDDAAIGDAPFIVASDSTSFAVAFEVETLVAVDGTLVESTETPVAAPRKGIPIPGNTRTSIILPTMTPNSRSSTIRAAQRMRPTDAVRSRIGRE